MEPKTLRLLTGVLLGLFGLWLALVVMQHAGREKDLLWPDALKARRLMISRPGDSVTLVKAKAWRIEAPLHFAANSEAVENLLEKLSKAEISEPLSSDPARHSLFSVNPSSAIRVQGFGEDGKPALDVLAGRQGTDYDSIFVRGEGSDVVREARGLARYELDREPGAWADTTVCAIDELKIASLEVRAGKSSRRFRRSGEHWPKEAGPMLSALARLGADSVATETSLDSKALSSLKNPELSISIKAKDAQENVELAVGSQIAGSRYPVRKKGVSGVVYLLPEWRVATFRPNPAPAARPSKPGR